MDKRRQELEELQDDIDLALLMDEYAESMGAEVRAEAEKAFENGEITIPQELDDACASILAQSSKADNHNKSTKTLVRYCLVAAATVVVLMGTLMVAQAAGINVFGKLASWTDSVFRFSSETNTLQPEDKEELTEIECALSDLGLPTDLAPLRFPEGYAVTNIKKSETEYVKIVGVSAEMEGQMVQVSIEEHIDAGMTDKASWEKNHQSAQVFISNGRAFYIFENEQGWSASWFDGRYTISLFGYTSYEDILVTIQSIGERLE